MGFLKHLILKVQSMNKYMDPAMVHKADQSQPMMQDMQKEMNTDMKQGMHMPSHSGSGE